MVVNGLKSTIKKSEIKLNLVSYLIPYTKKKKNSHKTHIIEVEEKNLWIILKTVLSYEMKPI